MKQLSNKGRTLVTIQLIVKNNELQDFIFAAAKITTEKCMTDTDWSQYKIIAQTSEAKRWLTNSPQRKVEFFTRRG